MREPKEPAKPLSDAKAALLDKWMRGKRGAPVDAAIPKRDASRPAPLSFAQQRLWFLHRLDPASAAYNMVNEYRLRGPLDRAALQAALTEIVRRHEALRTVFETQDGTPVQRVQAAGPVDVPFFDLAPMAPDARTDERARHEREETTKPLDPSAGPLMRVRLLRLAEDDHALLVTVHHVAFDEASELRFQHELAALYTDMKDGREPSLPEPPIQYADYAQWQRHGRDAAAESARLDRWATRLEKLPSLDLPTDNVRPATPSGAGRMQEFHVDARVADRFRALCKAEGATLFMGLLAAYQTVLHRHAGQDDFAVGSPVSGRTRPETNDLIGFFVNTLVLRADFSGAPSFRETLRRTRLACLAAYDDQDVPFERVVERVQPERDPARTPLFQALFSLQNRITERPRPSALEMSARFVESPTAKFDLSLYMLDEADGLKGWLEHNTDVFEPATAAALCDHLVTLIEAASDAPDTPVAELPLMGEHERRRIVPEIRSGDPPALPAPHVPAMFARAVAEHSERTAVEAAGSRLTYAGLEERVRDIEAALLEAGVSRGDVVGLCIDRTLDLPAAVLAVLRVGAAYLPLDPAYPEERLASMLDDSGARHILVGESLGSRLPKNGNARHIPVPVASPARVGTATRGSPPTPEDIAYVLYTSGTTGKPKGTPVHHAALVNLLTSMGDSLRVGSEDSLLSVTTLNFDIGTLELLLPLVNGATLRLVQREVARDPAALLTEMPGATLMQATPATWRMLVEAGWPEVSPNERRLRVVSGGEPLAPDLARALQARALEVWNGYGPTETTIYSTLHRVRAEDLEAARIPIGRPIANTRAHVLDAHGGHAATGIPGELVLGGLGVSRGYLGRPDLTAERFVDEPGNLGSKAYRTGDLVRWRPDGTLDYLGRLDRQVKIRGFRIEPGEIEAALQAHDDITRAIVVPRTSDGDTRLVAYVVPQVGAAEGLPQRLRVHLEARVPAHMMPAAFVAIERVPLNPNGKVDVRALPDPDEAHFAKATGHEPPQTPMERTLAAEWAQLLGVTRIGRDDGFFALGGHSLLATRLVASLEAKGISLPLRAVFSSRTLRETAAACTVGASSDGPIPALASRDGLPLSPAQERMWFLHRMDPDSPVYNMPFVHRLTGALDGQAFEAALSTTVRLHEALRSRIEEADGVLRQRIASWDAVELPFAHHDLRTVEAGLREIRLESITREQAEAPFDLASGLPFRASLIRIADDEHVFLFTVHHIAFDERSHDVLISDLASAYRAERDGTPAPTGPARQYGDHTAWLRDRLETGALAAVIDSWSERLAAAEPLALPAERSLPADRTFDGGHVAFTLSADARERLHALTRETGATPFMVLLAGFQAYLHRITRQERLLVATPTHGRHRTELDDAVGFFVNTVAMPAHISPGTRFDALVRTVRETAVDAQEHDEAPYAEVAARVQALHGRQGEDLAQAFFSYEPSSPASMDFAGLRLVSSMVPTPTAKFPLSIYLSDQGDRLKGAIEYATDLFDAAWAERHARCFGVFIEAALENPTAQVGALPVLDEAARVGLFALNPPATPVPHERVPDAFAREAARRPNAMAIETPHVRLRYHELQSRMEAIAARLRSAGAGPGCLVAVCLDRDANLIAGLLAVMRTGATYLPLDPTYPEERVRLILEDAGPDLVLTSAKFSPRFDAQARVVHVDEDNGTGRDHPPLAPRAQPLPADLAYVIHTSGSTGRPKGVMVPHAALTNFLHAMRDETQAGEEDRWVALTTVSFDIAGLELFLPLITGGALRLATRDEATDPEALGRLANDATFLQATPATWRMLIDGGWGGQGSLNALCGGEALPPDLARDIKHRVGRLWNVYGPTETTVWSTIEEVEAVEGPVPIGRPIANTRAYILDGGQNLVAPGVTGELHLAGLGVAAGYLGRPELTVERFLPDPFVPRERMYKTGDLARWRSDGKLEYLGRTDRQLKVRGFRIEPGEVEHAIRETALVRECVVLARGDGPADVRLVAYVVPTTASAGIDAALRKALGASLPAHMVPSTFVTMEALPLTPNRKVDINSLPAPEGAQGSGPTAARLPTGETEEALAALWRDLLGVEDVAAEDHFFQLGGHSLLATRLSARIRATFGVELPLRMLLATPTLEAQAIRIEEASVDRTPGHAASSATSGAHDDAKGRPSLQQQRLLFLQGLAPEGAAYNMAVVRRIRGPLRLDALEGALTEVVRRHAPLRTRYPLDESGAHRAEVLPAEPQRILVAEAADLAEAMRLASAAAHEPYDLGADAPIRPRIYRVAPDDHVLLIGLHHVAFDEWSERILLDELQTLYAARVAGRPPSLRPLASTYAQEAAATLRDLDSGAYDADITHWKRRLDGLSPLDLPTDRPRPSSPTQRGGTVPLALSPELADRLRTLCDAEGATLHMGLLAAWQTLLHRYSGQHDFAVGTPIAGRHAATGDLIGFFANTLALRADLAGAPSFRELISRTKAACLDAYAHDRVPLERLIDDDAPKRGLQRPPLFQVAFLLQPESHGVLILGDTTRWEPLALPSHTAKFDLTLALSETDGAGLEGGIEYSADLFERPSAERIADHFVRLVESLTATPEGSIADAELLTRAEAADIERWNDTAAPIDGPLLLHQRFAGQARRTPDAEALSQSGKTMTYAALDERANRLARVLLDKGVRKGDLVGVCTRRSFDTTVAILGVLKAGAAYLPLDPAYPRERLAFMLEDSAPRLVLVHRELADRLPLAEGRALVLDEVELALDDQDPSEPETDVSPDDLAYVIYTSGSTGKPKGVMLEHRGAANLAMAQARLFGVGPADRVLQFASLSFDASVWEWLMALTTGATLCLGPEGETLVADALRATLESERVSIATLPPTALATLPDDASLPALRTLIVAGESCAPHLVERWSRGRTFVNAYGPTEASVCVTAHLTRDAGATSLPIGHALPNMTAHVLDARGRPVPVGVPGELHAGGVGLARGYLNRPELTEERFVPHPTVAGERLYRTGDLVKRRSDGALEFLGRIDHQVKIRGYRIELGEVESVLDELAEVAEAVAVAREDVPGTKRLVAYVRRESASLDAAGLRAHAEVRLPLHMVPSAFVILDAFPLTPNGKVDRKALPAPEDAAGERPEGADGSTAPRTKQEAALARIWRDVLRARHVGIHDNFFDLGGDSILSIQVVARANKAGIPLKTRHIFDHQTIAELAALDTAGREVRAEQGLVEGEVPLTPIQRWFVERELPQRDHFNQSVLLELQDHVPESRVKAAVERLVAHHDALRLRLTEDAKAHAWTQDHAPLADASSACFERLDLSGISDIAAQDDAFLHACERAQTSLRPAEGRNLRAVLFDLGPERRRRLLLAVHHNAVDGVSWRILLEDLENLLGRSEDEGEADVSLPPKTTSFREWATKLDEHARSDAVAAEAPYWLSQTVEARIPRDHAGENRLEHEDELSVAFTEDESHALLRDVPTVTGARPEEAMLAALARALGQWCDTDEVLIELEGHGREEILPDVDISRTVGWFTTTYPLRLDAPRHLELPALLDRVSENVRRVPNRGIGHGLLRHLGPADTRAALDSVRAPEVSFNYLGRFDDAATESGEPPKSRMLDEPHGADYAKVGARHRLVELNGAVMNGRLSIRFTWSSKVHARPTLQGVADKFRQSLLDIINGARESAKMAAGADNASLAATAERLGLDPQRLAQALDGRENVADAYPLTPMQEGMVFHSLREADTGVYVEQSVFRLDGDLDLDAIENAWRHVVGRHDVLRTSFAWRGLDEPLQVVHSEVQLPVERLDWRELDADGFEARLDAYLEQDRRTGFDLARPPLMRVALLREGEGRHAMVWTNHHALLDGWSLPVILDELGQAYAAFRDGRQPTLGAPLSFRKFVDHVRARSTTAAESHWRAELAGFHEPTPLPLKERIAERDARLLPGEAKATLSPQRLERLQALARRARVTLGTLIQGAWALTLGRHTDRRDVVFGATVSGRPPELAGIETMVGLFINTLPVRVKLDDDRTLVDWLAALQSSQVRAREHEHVPIVRIQSWSSVPRGASLFETLVVFENYPWSEGSLQALPIRAVEGRSRTNFPLTLVAAPGEGLGLRIFHEAGRFDEADVERLMTRLVHTLAEMGNAEADLSLKRLTAVTPSDVESMTQWGAATTAAAAACVHDLFAEQARSNPGLVAIEHEDTSYTYAELEEKSTRFAARLVEEGVKAGTLVALAVKPSADALAALLGVLKAGAAYVPLDPDYPAERLAYMLEDSGATHIVTTSGLSARYAGSGARVLHLDDPTSWATVGSPSAQAATPGDLAYVIYTSGSTGRPKGTLVTHRGAAALARAQRETFGIAPGTRILQFASWSFDASFWEILMALANGGTLCLMGERAGGEALETFLDTQNIHVATLPPTVLRSLRPERVPGLRVVVSAGEELSGDLARTWAPERALFNAYGPTEATVCATIKRCASNEAAPTIGRPFASARIVLLDSERTPVPPGVPGEICIGGPCVARGYHGQPELTDERFIADPFVDGERLYRTGDLARWTADGELEFLGRRDHQVKIRGHRIECGEVEAALRLHPSVENAFVMARADDGGAPRLVAYLTGGAIPPHDELRAHLRARLPDVMVPSAFVALPELPLTPNGKVDRKALPSPSASLSRSGVEHVAPRDPVEQILAGIWERVLQTPRIGVRDDFFELGGHSLNATQVVSRIRDALDVEVPLRTVFAARTLEGLADAVRELRRDEKGLAVPPVTPGDDNGSAPLSFSQQRLWFLDQWEPGSAVYNIPAFYRLQGRLDVRALESALSETIRRHEVLRTVYGVDDEGQPVQIVKPHERLALAIEDLTRRPVEKREAEAQRIADDEARRPFDLANGPVHRVKLLKLAPDEHWMLLSFHHVAFDGWSMGVVLHEVGELYDAYRAGRPPTLPEPPVQYADYARWQRAHLDERALAPQLDHWRDALSHVRALDLPTDKPRPKVQSFRGGHRWFALPEKLSQRLKSFSREMGVTLYMPLLAAFQTLIHRWSGQTDFAVGSPVAGRTRAETEGLVGFFVNTLALPAPLQGDPSFREFLQRVRGHCLDAYANQDVPFERLVSELQLPRDTSRSPLFQTMFVLQEEALEGAKWGEVSVHGIPVSSLASKFDITLFVADAGDRLEGLVEYRTDLFEAATMERLARQFESLVASALDDPDAPLSQLELLPESERDLVLRAWNDTARPYEAGRRVHELFEAQAARRPDAPALCCGARTYTYQQLDARAEAISQALQARGVKPGDVVGVCLERSLDTAAAPLGVMKAGCVYLPLDARYPSERLAFMLDDTQARIVLAHERLAPALASWKGALLHAESILAEAAPAARPKPQADAQTPAYIIYTSGSTGKPKGVVVRHGGVNNLVQNAHDVFGIHETSRVLQFASPAFDGSIPEIFGALTNGACLIVPTPENTLTGGDLHALMSEQRVTFAILPPAALGTLPLDAPMPHFERLMTAGEALPARLAKAWSGRVRMANAYGPTEGTVAATIHELAPGFEGAPPIGAPLPNVRTYVLDDRMRPAPIGVPGELWLGGAGIAECYHERPELTAERFVESPFEQDDRLYRTGDLVRWNAEGQLEFLGRLDHQVKLRGFRIELGEIEATLQSHPDIAAATVVAREDSPGHKRLVAYIVPTAGDAPSSAEIRAFLGRTLPDHMVPAAYVAMESLPLTPNGKVDRKALPSPDAAQLPATVYESPATPTERSLCEVWQKALKLERVGVKDNFFDIGGDSILSIRVIALAEQRGLRLEPKTIFEHQTVRALARAIDAGEGETRADRSLITLHGGGERTPLFLVHPAGGGVGGFVGLANRLPGDRAIHAFQAPGVEPDSEPIDDITRLAERYVVEMREAQPRGPYLLGGWSFGALVAHEAARLLEAAGEQVSHLLLIEPAPPRSLDAGGQASFDLADDAGALPPAALRELGLARAGDVPEEKLRRHLAVFRAHAAARARHEPGPVSASTTLFVTHDTLKRLPEIADAWRPHITGAVDERRLEGDHYSLLLDDTYLGATVEAIVASLTEDES